VLDESLELGRDRALLDATVEQMATFASGVPAPVKSSARKSRRR
jgi:hypothetical protein